MPADQNLMEPRSVSAAHGWEWIKAGYALFRKSPAAWLLLLLVLFVSAKLVLLLFAAAKLMVFLQLAGLVLVLLMPVFVAGLMEGCRALERGQPLQIGHLLCGFNRNAAQLVTVGGVSLVGNAAVMMLVISLGGEAMFTMARTLGENQPMTPQITEQMHAAAATVGRALLIGTLVSVPLLMALWYAPLLVYFDDMKPLAALRSSFVACMKNALPLLVYGVVIMAGMFLALPFSMVFGQYDLALWLLAPIIVPSLYASYMDVYCVRPAHG